MSVQRVKQETTATELVTWIEYLRMDKEKTLDLEKQDFYLAQIASEVRRSFVKSPLTVKTADFILDFKAKKDKKPMTREEAAAASKRYWFSLTGFKEDANVSND